MKWVEPFLFLESPCIEASSNDGDHCAAEVHASLIKHGSCTSSRAASQWLVQNSYRSGPTLKPCTMLSYTASVFSRCDQGDARLMHRGFYSGPRTIRILHEPLRCCAVACAWPMLYQCRMYGDLQRRIHRHRWMTLQRRGTRETRMVLFKQIFQ